MANNDNGKSKADQYREERKARLAKAAKKTASKSEKSMKIQKLVQKTISIVLVAALVSLIGWNILGFTGAIQILTPVMTIGSEKVSARDFNYYYVLMYNYTTNQSQQYQQQYGQDVMGFDTTKSPADQNYPQPNEAGETITWAKYLSNTAIERAQQFEALYNEALTVDKAKYSLTDEEKTKLNDQIEQIRTTAAKQSLSINSYLREFYGKGINERFLKKQLEKETIVERYNTDKSEEFKTAWTDEKVKTFYESAKDDYDVVSLRYFTLNADKLTANEGESADALAARQKTANEATKAKAEGFLAGITDEATFISSAKTNTVVAEGATFDEDADTANFNKVKSTVESSISKEAADWAFADGRKTGDKSVFQKDTGDCFIVWLKTPQFPPITVDVRHILIGFKEDPQSQEAATTEEIAAAKNKADSVYKTWQDGEKTEDSFAELAKTMSTDTGSAENGGLYDNMTVGQMVAPFENWAFDSTKKPGDTGIVKTTFGYHIMYMVSNDAKNFQYITDIREEKAAEDNEKFVKDLMESDKYKLTKNDKNITKAEAASLKVINTQIELQQQQQ
jgi:parvulin-like peptidyl-prolyl isomerase